MKNISCWFELFILMIILCSCSDGQTKDINSGVDKQSIEITLNSNEHTELNLG